MKVLVTGASGFVGGHLCRVLSTAGHEVVACVRSPESADKLAQVVSSAHAIPCVTDRSAWMAALDEVHAVVHLAARVHVMEESAADPLREFRRTNVEGTRQVAGYAAESGVNRFVFVSSIKVNGEVTSGTPFRPGDVPAPVDPYGISKLEAEQSLRELRGPMEVVTVRPPLIYGPGVQGNFAKLIRWVELGVPLPLAAVNNKRDFVGVFNFCDMLRCCLEADRVRPVMFVSDGESVSTGDLVRLIADTRRKSARLFPVPLWLCRFALGAALSQRLLSDLQLDISETQKVLGWSPPLTMEASLAGVGT